uniref:Uncharacterized protein n=1 Tax=Avena sativa TaxID=4498 RepID=A0ACD5WNG7_AVESA
MASSRGRWASPERTVVWTEPPPKSISTATRRHGAPPTKVAVVYYLSRNGQLDHPHFMEVTLSSPQDGLCLRDVLHRLNVLRGAGIADAYSWSSKRSYKNGYVWHDLTADDPVHPASGNEYVLKGSELLCLPQLPVRPRDASASSTSSTSSCEPSKTRLPEASGRAGRRKNWSSFDLGEYRVAAAVQMGAADAATQTDDRRRGRNAPLLSEQEASRTELGIDEISPPPSSSSPDTLETLIEHDARLAAANKMAVAPEHADAGRRGEEVGVISGGRMRASAVLMQLISCGSIPAPAKQDRPRYAAQRRLPRGRSDLSSSTGTGAADGFSGSLSGASVGMDREYFSGSLVETKKTATDDCAGVGGEVGALKRSSSYNADRAKDLNMMRTRGCSKLELTAAEEEVDGVRARCIPAARKQNSGNNRRGNQQQEPTALTEEK